MAENTTDEPLDSPANLPSENSSEEIIPIIETEAINPDQEIETMEVHHHSHASHGKKNWKIYFWEFLMLFLAVFCGFLAEYKLEHVIENQREETLMRSLTEDLQADAETLANYIKWRTEINQDFDTVLQLLSQPDLDSNAYMIYQKSKVAVLRFGLPDIHEGTIQQLKNAGGLRLVRKKEVLNEINNHYLTITRMKSIYEVEVLVRIKLSESMGEVLDAKLLVNDHHPDSFKLATTEKTKINSYMNSMLAAKEINQKLIHWLESTRENTLKLNQLVVKEYSIQ